MRVFWFDTLPTHPFGKFQFNFMPYCSKNFVLYAPPPPPPHSPLEFQTSPYGGGYGKFLEPHNFQPIGRTTQILVVTCHQYGISTLVPQTAFHLETSGGMAKWQLFTQAKQLLKIIW